MGSRTMPSYCDHGVVMDHGDFGPTCPIAEAQGEDYTSHCADPENCEDCYPTCTECDATKARADAVRAAEQAVIEAAVAWATGTSDHPPSVALGDLSAAVELLADLPDTPCPTCGDTGRPECPDCDPPATDILRSSDQNKENPDA